MNVISELHRRLVELGHAISTILVTAYPDNEVRDPCALKKDGVVCYLRKPVDENHLMHAVPRAALHSDEPRKENSSSLPRRGNV